MDQWYLVLTIFIFSFAGLSAGVIFSNKVLKGSCGGLGALMGKCQFCESKDQCQKSKNS